MISTPDELAAATREIALAALHEITPASTIGPAAGYTVEPSGALSLRFENRLPGYPGWYWTVSVAQLDDAEPTVLETELMPGDSALLAPDWVPWTERLAEYRAHQAELAAAAAAEGTESGDADANVDSDDADVDLDGSDEDDDSDDEDVDEHDVTARLHAGDLDGVDIDELDESAASDDDDNAEDDDNADNADDEAAPEDAAEEE
ncbi:DUF3027 domain-containing protein [uncultured Microbacterium sp.]|uniref:DUF3027 domain-containing protein n=1 Tax=uncultured Microbacterium sp. TaxID=191216 RepID=UPI00263601EF|nr:DUF3027 domain-containing protein [uncultured Microbacterium sp.]